MRLLLALALLAWLPAQARAQDLSGTWFGERWTGTMLVQHLSHRSAEGRFTVRFRFLEGCAETGGQHQTGRWLLVGEEFRTWVETVDGAPPRAEGGELAITYILEDATGDRIAYRAPNDVLHRAFRVAPDYQMPPPLGCGAIS